MKRNTLLLLLVVFYGKGFGQSQISHSEDTTQTEKATEVFNQFALGSGFDGGITPKATVKTFKYSALIGKGYWDFYFFNSLPTIAPAEGDSVENAEARRTYVRNDLVKQVGGLLNVSLSKVGYFAYGGEEEAKEVQGAQVDFRIGAKAVDVFNRRKDESLLIPILQSTFELRYLIPLIPPDKQKNETLKISDRKVGGLHFRVLGAFMQVLNTEIYEKTFITKRGVPASPTVFAGTFETFFFISNKVYINVGYTFTNQEQIPNTPFFSISYGSE